MGVWVGGGRDLSSGYVLICHLSTLSIVKYFSTGDLPECARLSGNSDESLDDRELHRALEDSTRDAKKQRQQHGISFYL